MHTICMLYLLHTNPLAYLNNKHLADLFSAWSILQLFLFPHFKALKCKLKKKKKIKGNDHVNCNKKPQKPLLTRTLLASFFVNFVLKNFIFRKDTVACMIYLSTASTRTEMILFLQVVPDCKVSIYKGCCWSWPCVFLLFAEMLIQRSRL